MFVTHGRFVMPVFIFIMVDVLFYLFIFLQALGS